MSGWLVDEGDVSLKKKEKRNKDKNGPKHGAQNQTAQEPTIETGEK